MTDEAYLSLLAKAKVRIGAAVRPLCVQCADSQGPTTLSHAQVVAGLPEVDIPPGSTEDESYDASNEFFACVP